MSGAKRSVQRSLQAGLEWFRTEEVQRTGKAVLWGTLLCSLAAHGFLFTNEMFSHDSISYYTYATGTPSFYLSIGRFVIPVYELIKGAVAAPWLIGLLFFLWTALTSFLLVRLFRIHTVTGQVLVSGLVCTNLALTLTGATYIYCMDEYAFALFAATVSVCCFVRGGRWILPGLCALVLSLAVYQAYFTVAASLCLLVVLRQLSERETVNHTVHLGVRCLVLLAMGFSLYYAFWSLLCGGFDVAKQRVEESLLGDFSLGKILTLVLEANVTYVRSLFDGSGVLGWLLPVVHVGLLLLLLWRLGQFLGNRTIPLGSKALMVLLVCLIPTAFHSAAILLAGTATELMCFAGELLYLLLLLAVEPGERGNPIRRSLRSVGIVLLCCVLWQHIVYANQVYMKKELDQNASVTLASRMIDRVERMEGYVPGETPVAFVGRLDHNAYLNHGRPAFSNLQGTAGLWDDYAQTYNMGRYLTDYLNYPLCWDTETDFSRREEVERMPVFPAQDSIAMVDGTVVIKLSDERK